MNSLSQKSRPAHADMGASPLDPRALRSTLGCYPTGVTIVTAVSRTGALLGLTVNSFASVSLAPPLVLWSQARTSPTHDEFLAAPRMVINILSQSQQDISNRFSRPADNKFEGIDFSYLPCGTPVLDDCAATLICTPQTRYEGGDHTIHLCAVDTFANHSLEPLIFCRGNYVSPQMAAI